MAGEALISFAGNATAAAELRFTKQGVAVAGWTVAVTPRVKRGDEYADGETTFYRCTAWRKRAEPCAESITKGMRVAVTGRLTTREYETTSGEKRLSLEVEVDTAGPDLLFHTAKVSRFESGSGETHGRSGSSSAPSADPWGDVPPPDEPPF